MKQKRVKCPVCKETYWSHTIKGHIINMGSREVYRAADTMIQYAKNKPYTFSPYVLLRNCPHYHYRRQHIKNKLIFEL
jgi:uncharacterized protein (DUF2225 family)